MRMLLDIEFDTMPQKHSIGTKHRNLFVKDKDMSKSYCQRFCEASLVATETANLNAHACHIRSAMECAAEVFHQRGREPQLQAQGTMEELQKLSKVLKRP